MTMYNQKAIETRLLRFSLYSQEELATQLVNLEK